MVPVLLPLEPPEPMLPLEPVLCDGVLGDVVLGDVVVLVLPLPVAPPAAPAPDLLKWASHSEREICPSLLVSTAEKLGAELLLLALPDRPPLEPDADGVDDDVSLPVLLLDDELCATATPDSANNAAAVAALTNLSFNIG